MILILPVLVMSLFALPAEAKSWEIPTATINLRLEPDGSLLVTERRTFRFQGEFSHIYQKINLWEQSAVTEITLKGPDGAYQPSEQKRPGTYTWNGKQIDWYFRALDTDQTYTLTYRVTNAIAMHEDAAELHWQAIGTEWERGTGKADVMIQLPAAPVEAWVTDNSGSLTIQGQQVRVMRNRLPKEDALEVRIFLPKEALATSTVPSDGKSLDQILKRAGRRPDPVSRAIHFGWTALAFLAAFWFYRLHVQRPKLEPASAPEPLSPVLVARLLGQKPTDALRAALAELATAGALLVEQEPRGDWRFTRQPGVPVPALEQPALAIMLPEGRESITLKEWKETVGKQQQTYTDLTQWWVSLQNELPETWFLPYRWWGWLLAATVVPLLIMTNPGFSMAAPVLAALLLMALSLMQRRYSEEGEQVRQGWLRQKRHLDEAELVPTQVGLALALGLPLKRMLDPTTEIGNQFAWVQATDVVLVSSYGAFVGAGAGAAGAAGGNGGGGGGAS